MVATDITEDAVLILRAIADTRGRFGLQMPIDILRGKRSARLIKHKLDQLECHGLGKHRSENQWKLILGTLEKEKMVCSRTVGGKGFERGVRLYKLSEQGLALAGGNGPRVFADLPATCESSKRSGRPESSGTEHVAAAKNHGATRRTPKPGKPPPECEGGGGQNACSARPDPTCDAGTSGTGLSELSSSAKAGTSCLDQKPLLTSVPTPRGRRRKVPASRQTFLTTRSSEDGLVLPPHPGEIPAPTPLPAALDAALLPFQRAGVAFAVRHGGRCLIGDDMGLGKTIQAIATCCAFRQDWPALVVVPNSLRLVWAEELERWIPDLGPGAVNVVRAGKDISGFKNGKASFHIVTYGLLARASPVQELLRTCCFKVVVADESHMIKNREALRTQEVLKIVAQASRVLLLSGTPALARPVELYSQICAIAPELFSSFDAFAKRFCAPKRTPFGMDYTGASHLEELHAHLRSIMVRRLKADVLDQLPSKRRQRIQLEIDPSLTGNCVTLMRDLKKASVRQERHQILTKLYSATAKAKTGPVCEYVEDLIRGGCKFLVFGHHLHMLDSLESACVRSKVRFIRIDGSVSFADRQRQVREFQADEGVRVAILGLVAGGVGITLTAASTVVFAELHWTPGLLVQAEDRAHRIGQKSSVNIHYLLAGGTADDVIWPSVSRKVQVVSAMCNGRKDRLVAELAATGCVSEAPDDAQEVTVRQEQHLANGMLYGRSLDSEVPYGRSLAKANFLVGSAGDL
eukprot:TRINITY_DN17713_c0_g1_i2.p1 TRINITY_DN17713_c0_g1~~TRINITY_DN17713_c0_g1_i2.p1  ORF type:complete len:748 (+),score=116.45 TRINITY_DN17713_c0_g1_i2:117-2360(+)